MKAKRQNNKWHKSVILLFSQTKPDSSLFLDMTTMTIWLAAVCLLFAPHVMSHETSALRGFSAGFYNETTK